MDQQQKPTMPTHHILDQRFRYTPAAKTDLMQKFRQMGWTPPTEHRSNYDPR